MGDDTTSPTRGEGLSTGQPQVSYAQVYGPKEQARELGGTLWADFNDTRPKARASILLQAPSAELAASLGMVTRWVPKGALRDTEACSEAFHGQEHPGLALGQAGLPGTSSGLTLAQETFQVQPKTEPKKTLGQAPAPNPGPRDPGPNSDPGPRDLRLNSDRYPSNSRPSPNKHQEACGPTVTPVQVTPDPNSKEITVQRAPGPTLTQAQREPSPSPKRPQPQP